MSCKHTRVGVDTYCYRTDGKVHYIFLALLSHCMTKIVTDGEQRKTVVFSEREMERYRERGPRPRRTQCSNVHVDSLAYCVQTERERKGECGKALRVTVSVQHMKVDKYPHWH